MDTNSVPPDVRWAIATFPDDAPRGAVTRFCEQHGIGRTVFYKIRKIALERGAMAATEPGSRRPKTSPGKVDDTQVAQALAVRAWLVAQGLDQGPISVIDKMTRMGLTAPSRATLARVFRTRGVVQPEPRKRPRSANRRFVYPAPNCCWQLDSTQWSLDDGSVCVVYQLLDDHSRLALASLVARTENSKDAVRVVTTAIRRWGVPQKFLSDNGTAFNPTRRGYTGKLVELLKDMGVTPITGRPGRPMTQGKNERFHQPLHKWLNARPPAKTLAELQGLVDEFDLYYNHERGHQSLAMRTPWEAWNATPAAPEPTPEPRLRGVPPPPAPRSEGPRRPPTQKEATDRHVTAAGQVRFAGCAYYVGQRFAGQQVHLLATATIVEIFDPAGEQVARYTRPADGRAYLGARHALFFAGAATTRGPRPAAATPALAPRPTNRGTTADHDHPEGTDTRKINTSGTVTAFGCTFYLGYRLAGTNTLITWNDAVVTFYDPTGKTILKRFTRPRRPGQRFTRVHGQLSTKP